MRLSVVEYCTILGLGDEEQVPWLVGQGLDFDLVPNGDERCRGAKGPGGVEDAHAVHSKEDLQQNISTKGRSEPRESRKAPCEAHQQER